MDILEDQKKKYLSRRIAEIAELKSAIDEGNFEKAVSIGHKLKGNGETFGFPMITTIGMTMENAAKARDLDKVKETIAELEDSVARSLRSYEH